jgi:hypothetical protein
MVLFEVDGLCHCKCLAGTHDVAGGDVVIGCGSPILNDLQLLESSPNMQPDSDSMGWRAVVKDDNKPTFNGDQAAGRIHPW